MSDVDPIVQTSDGVPVPLRRALELESFGLCSRRLGLFEMASSVREGLHVVWPGVEGPNGLEYPPDLAIAFEVSTRAPKRVDARLTLSVTGEVMPEDLPGGYFVEGTGGCEDPRLVGSWLTGLVHVIARSDVSAPLLLRVRWEDAQRGRLEDSGVFRKSSGSMGEPIVVTGAVSYLTNGARGCVEADVFDLTGALLVADAFCVEPGETQEREYDANVVLPEVEEAPEAGCGCREAPMRASHGARSLVLAAAGLGLRRLPRRRGAQQPEERWK